MCGVDANVQQRLRPLCATVVIMRQKECSKGVQLDDSLQQSKPPVRHAALCSG